SKRASAVASSLAADDFAETRTTGLWMDSEAGADCGRPQELLQSRSRCNAGDFCAGAGVVSGSAPVATVSDAKRSAAAPPALANGSIAIHRSIPRRVVRGFLRDENIMGVVLPNRRR